MHYSSEKIHSSAELRALLAFALENQITAESILSNTGLEQQELAQPGTLISISQMFTAIQNALSRLNDPHLGLKLGLKMQITAYGMFGYALVSSTTVRAACHFAEKYQALTMPMSTQKFRETNTHGRWIPMSMARQIRACISSRSNMCWALFFHSRKISWTRPSSLPRSGCVIQNRAILHSMTVFSTVKSSMSNP
jgi:hypothetical protein